MNKSTETAESLALSIKELMGINTEFGYGMVIEDFLDKKVSIKETCFVNYNSDTRYIVYENNDGNDLKNFTLFVRMDSNPESFVENFKKVYSENIVESCYGKFAVQFNNSDFSYALNFNLIIININLIKD